MFNVDSMRVESSIDEWQAVSLFCLYCILEKTGFAEACSCLARQPVIVLRTLNFQELPDISGNGYEMTGRAE